MGTTISTSSSTTSLKCNSRQNNDNNATTTTIVFQHEEPAAVGYNNNNVVRPHQSQRTMSNYSSSSGSCSGCSSSASSTTSGCRRRGDDDDDGVVICDHPRNRFLVGVTSSSLSPPLTSLSLTTVYDWSKNERRHAAKVVQSRLICDQRASDNKVTATLKTATTMTSTKEKLKNSLTKLVGRIQSSLRIDSVGSLNDTRNNNDVYGGGGAEGWREGKQEDSWQGSRTGAGVKAGDGGVKGLLRKNIIGNTEHNLQALSCDNLTTLQSVSLVDDNNCAVLSKSRINNLVRTGEINIWNTSSSIWSDQSNNNFKQTSGILSQAVFPACSCSTDVLFDDYDDNNDVRRRLDHSSRTWNKNINYQQPRRTIVQASTTDLLLCLGEYLRRRCRHLADDLETNDVGAWLRDVDQSLLVHGWQDTPFVNPANVVFVFLLVRSEVDLLRHRTALVTDDYSSGSPGPPLIRRVATNKSTSSPGVCYPTPFLLELKALVLTCLYLAYSYMGSEISYPLRQFLVLSPGADSRTEAGLVEDKSNLCRQRSRFWTRCLRLVAGQSHKMLRINTDPVYFADVFGDLVSYSVR